MILTNKQIEQLIGDTELYLAAAAKNLKIKTHLLDYRYDEARLAIGEGLLAEAKSEYENRIKAGGKQLVATSELETAIMECQPVYMEHLTIGRMILKNEPGKMAQYSMAGERKTSFTGWYLQVEAFYNSIIADEELLAQYAEYGVAREDLDAGLALLTRIKDINALQEEAKAEAQEATRIRNNAIETLADWSSDFRVILKLALASEPQLLEAVGIVARSD